jgi:hypothetical protein
VQQLEAAARFSAEASVFASSFIDHYAQLESEMNRVPETHGVDVSSYLQSHPLPDQLVQLLAAFGETPVQIANMGKNLSNLVPGLADDPTAGIVALRTSTLATEASAVQDLSRAISVRSSKLGLPARDPTAQELAELNSKRSEIVNELTKPTHAASIVRELAELQDAVLGLAVDTNNISALKAYLSFGQAAVLTLQKVSLASLNHTPALASIDGRQVDEGAKLAFSATATDPDAGQTLTYSLDAGAPTGAQIDPSTGAFTWTALAPGKYSVAIRVTDNGSPAKSDSRTFSATVNNVAPTVNAGSNTTIVQGTTLTRSGSFADPGSEVWTATLDYGDGTAVARLALGSAKTFRLSHSYTAPGAYVVTVRVNDSVGGLGTSRFVANVVATPTGPPPAALVSGFGPGRDAFVTTIYREQLGRFPEFAGLRYWSGKLAAGVRPLTVAYAIWNSPEHRRLVHQNLAPAISLQRSFLDSLRTARHTRASPPHRAQRR